MAIVCSHPAHVHFLFIYLHGLFAFPRLYKPFQFCHYEPGLRAVREFPLLFIITVNMLGKRLVYTTINVWAVIAVLGAVLEEGAEVGAAAGAIEGAVPAV